MDNTENTENTEIVENTENTENVENAVITEDTAAVDAEPEPEKADETAQEVPENAEETAQEVPEQIDEPAKAEEPEKPDETVKVKEPRKKSFLKDNVRNLVSGLANVFKNYPITMIMILIAAIFAAVLVHIEYNDDMRDAYEGIMEFAFCMAAQGFVIEEVFRRRIKPKVGAFIFAVVFASIFVFVDKSDRDYLFGIDFERIEDIWQRIWVVYGIMIYAWVIYHLHRRIYEDFEEYCTRSFLTIAKSYVIYGIFAVGLAVIIYIFDELILDTHDLLECSEVFLAIGFISAMTIRALSERHEKPGRFARICVLYAMLPMLIIAFAIIYVYMIKIFVMNDVPSNSVFGILSGLFSVGLPIWTMGHDIGEGEKGISRAAFIVPYVFIPFIFLQSWSLYIRIDQYGFTSQRYFGIVLIVFEILYFILYILSRITKKDMIYVILIAFAVAAPICTFIPRVCFDDVVINSQLGRIRSLISESNIGASDKRQISSAYATIMNVSYRGENALETRLTAEERELIEECRDSNNGGYPKRVYLRDTHRISEINISEYSRIYETGRIDWYYGDDEEHPYEESFSTLDGYEAQSRECTVDLEEFIRSVTDKYDTDNETDFRLGSRKLMKIDKDTDLFIKDITLSYEEDTGDKPHIEMSGYLLER